MLNEFIKRNVGKWLLVSLLMSFGLAMAQAEPTLNQVYEAAQAGRLEQAQVMMQQVLVAHPGSGKAHFVQGELWARQGKLSQAREALATAEKLAPGLPFAKPEAVQALRAQLTAKSTSLAVNRSNTQSVAAGAPNAPAASFPWGLALMLGGAAIALVIFLTRKKPAATFDPQSAYANPGNFQGGLNGPQGFGMGAGGMAQPYQPYGQPAGSGLGGRVMGGLATGLAVGAGVMAAQAIGKNLMGNNDSSAHPLDNAAGNGFEPLSSNSDMGGQNFGVNDTSSWDDGGGAIDSGGGGDWDN
jgi:hypothetical protein